MESMTTFDYAAYGHSVPENIVQAHQAAWQRLAGPGSWWTGAQRVEMARLAREGRAQRNDPPWLRHGSPASSDLLPARAADAVRRIAADVHSIDAAWATEAAQELGDAAYVEICAVTVYVTAIDAFADALGVPLEPLPEPVAGEPDGVRPEGTAEAGAFVPMLDPFPGPNVARALSLAPADNRAFRALVGSMYAMADWRAYDSRLPQAANSTYFQDLVWENRPLTRPQVELVAARVSSVNECFY